MTNKQVLIREIETLPPHIIDEVYDYVNFLKEWKMKTKKVSDITLASEKSLAKDWLRQEEDSAWGNL